MNRWSNTPAFNLPSGFPQSSLLFNPKTGESVNISSPSTSIILDESFFAFDSIDIVKYKTYHYVFVEDHIVGFGWDDIEKRDNIIVGTHDEMEYLIDGYGLPLTEPHEKLSSGEGYDYFVIDGSYKEKKHIPLFPLIEFDSGGTYESLYSLNNIENIQNNIICWEYTLDNGLSYTVDFAEIINRDRIYGRVLDEHVKTNYDLIDKTTESINEVIIYEHVLGYDEQTKISKDKDSTVVDRNSSLKNLPIYFRKKLQRFFN